MKRNRRGFQVPAGGLPAGGRLEVFLAVREDLESWRRTMAAASGQFAADQERQREGGVKDLAKLIYTGTDLMPVYAGFWTARNEALLAHRMGPGEYAYLYGLVYRQVTEPGRSPEGGKDFSPEALAEVLAPCRARLMAAFDADVDPVELIFQGGVE